MYKVLQATAMMSLMAFFVISSASTCQANTTTIDGKVFKTIKTDYVLYEPPLWFSMRQATPVVFYLHGLYGNDETSYERHLAELAKRGFSVVFLKWDQEDSRLYYSDLLTRFMVAYQDLSNRNVGFWRSRGLAPDIKNYGIVGHSLGGMYALKLAAELGWLDRIGFGSFYGVPKALILQDAGGFGSVFPFMTPGGERSLDLSGFIEDFMNYNNNVKIPTPRNLFWLDNLGAISQQTLLVMLLAGETAKFQFEKMNDPDSIDFGNATFSGVWTRAWHNTGLHGSRKHAFRVPNGGHWDVQSSTLALSLPYVNVTVNALNAGIGRSTFSSEQAGVDNFSFFMNWLYPTPWTPRYSQDEQWWNRIGTPR